MEIINYLPAQFDSIVDMYKNKYPFLVVTKDIFNAKVFNDKNYSNDGFFAATDKSKILGFCLAVKRTTPVISGYPVNSNEGYISLFCVEKDEDTKTVGAELLKAAERYLKSNGVKTVSTGYFPVYFCQGFEESLNKEYCTLFADNGYSHYGSSSYALDLKDYKKSEEIEKIKQNLIDEGYYIGPLTKQYEKELCSPELSFSNESWAFELGLKVKYNDYEQIIIAAKDNRLIGCAPFGDVLSDSGRFGPFGVNPNERGKGIGKVLMQEALCKMKSLNIKTAWMQWVARSGPAHHIYTNAGFKIRNNFSTFQKTL